MSDALKRIPPSLWPVKVLQDGFDGKFSGGEWIAYSDDQEERDDTIWNETQCDTQKAAAFWRDEGRATDWVAVGDTPDHAVEALLAKVLK